MTPDSFAEYVNAFGWDRAVLIALALYVLYLNRTTVPKGMYQAEREDGFSAVGEKIDKLAEAQTATTITLREIKAFVEARLTRTSSRREGDPE